MQSNWSATVARVPIRRETRGSRRNESAGNQLGLVQPMRRNQAQRLVRNGRHGGCAATLRPRFCAVVNLVATVIDDEHGRQFGLRGAPCWRRRRKRFFTGRPLSARRMASTFPDIAEMIRLHASFLEVCCLVVAAVSATASTNWLPYPSTIRRTCCKSYRRFGPQQPEDGGAETPSDSSPYWQSGEWRAARCPRRSRYYVIRLTAGTIVNPPSRSFVNSHATSQECPLPSASIKAPRVKLVDLVVA